MTIIDHSRILLGNEHLTFYIFSCLSHSLKFILYVVKTYFKSSWSWSRVLGKRINESAPKLVSPKLQKRHKRSYTFHVFLVNEHAQIIPWGVSVPTRRPTCIYGNVFVKPVAQYFSIATLYQDWSSCKMNSISAIYQLKLFLINKVFSGL